MNFEMENPSVGAAAAALSENLPDYHMDNSFNGKHDSDFHTGNDNLNSSNNADNNGVADYSHDGNGDENDQRDYSESQTNKRQASDFDSTSVSNNNSLQKRQKTGMNNMGNTQQRNFQRRDGQVDLRILLPSKDAGAIIGRGGANIKKLRQEHKTQIQVPDCNGPERLLLISGDIETCISALLDVIPLLEENQKFNSDGGASTELRLLVHQSQAGCIIGRGGDKIKELRIKHNLDMKVYSECAPMSTERVCQMKGKSPDIVQCLREAIGLLDTAPPKGMSRPYDPHNFDEFLSSQYGGFCNDKRGGPGGPAGPGGAGGPGGFQPNNNRGGFQQNNHMNSRGGHNNFNNNNRGGGFIRNNSSDGNGFNNENGFNNGMSRGGGRGGFIRGGGSDRGGDRGGFSRGGGGSDRGGRGGFNSNRGGGSDRGGARGGFNNNRGGGGSDRGGFGGRGGFHNNTRGGYNNNNNNNGGGGGNHGNPQNSYNNPGSQSSHVIQPGAQTNQVTIPNELAGAVIGPKGAKIQQIRDQSGAGITIDKPTPGTNDRIITIQGNAEQIQNAQYLLQITVKQSGLWQGN